jgi:sugar/nucleoside kinase (ribokinase family)
MKKEGFPARPKKVLIAGNAVLDITPVFPAGGREAFRECFVPGRLITMNGVDIHAGGACCNTGAALRFLGVEVSIVARIGRDAFGGILGDLMEQVGIYGGLLPTGEAGTSYTVVLAAPGTDRIFLHDPGVGDYFEASDIEAALTDEIGVFHFGYPPLMKRMYERSGHELIAMFEAVKSRGILTSLDMAMVTRDAPAASADWPGILTRLLPSVDFFLPSLEETCFFIDPKRYESWNDHSTGDGGIPADLSVSRDIAPLADRLVSMGAGVIVIKCGEHGMYYRTAGADRLSETAERMGIDVGDLADRSGFVPAFRAEKVVSANGAGDASIAGFLAGIVGGHGFDESLRLGSAAGACSVTGYDAVSGLLSIREMLAKIGDGWPCVDDISDKE